jgi:hypothetical protein
MEQIPSWEADSSLVGKEIPPLSWNPKVSLSCLQEHVMNQLRPVTQLAKQFRVFMVPKGSFALLNTRRWTVLSRLHPVHVLTSCLSKNLLMELYMLHVSLIPSTWV